MKALIILENGFEDTEALCTIDVLKRSNFEVVSASLKEKKVITQCGHSIEVNKILKDIESPALEYDMLILPGGKAVMQVLNSSKEIDNLIDAFYKEDKLIASICAAPILIGKRGYFDSLTYTCFPGCEEYIKKGTKGKDGVIESGNFITATSMYYTIPFALQIVSHFLGIYACEKAHLALKGYKK